MFDLKDFENLSINTNFIQVQKEDENSIIPTRGTEEAAGWDLYAAAAAIIPAGETVVISTGVRIAVPKGTFGGIFARSGLSIKQGLAPANCVGVVDSDYRGVVQVALHNHSKETREIKIGDRIAQLIVIEYRRANYLVEVDNLDEEITERGEGKFGSTGN